MSSMVDVANVRQDPASKRDLLEFLEFISDNEGSGDSSYGLELEFFERNGFSPKVANLLYWDFPYWVSHPLSPFAIQRPDGSYREAVWIEGSYDRDESYDPEGRDRAFCYGLALQLRNFFREKFDKPRLLKEEIDQFKFGDFPWLNSHKRLPEKFPFYEASDDELRAAFEYARMHYPEYIDYDRGLMQLVLAQGYRLCDVYGRAITTAYLNDSLLAVVPDAGVYGYLYASPELLRELVMGRASDISDRQSDVAKPFLNLLSKIWPRK
ncbi:hypothetical protein C0V72_04340 [Porphyrobacter sp. TH134]|nr:hypothetical protein C0V72_04340 [Porphyrobacter sp. TH134]